MSFSLVSEPLRCYTRLALFHRPPPPKDSDSCSPDFLILKSVRLRNFLLDGTGVMSPLPRGSFVVAARGWVTYLSGRSARKSRVQSLSSTSTALVVSWQRLKHLLSLAAMSENAQGKSPTRVIAYSQMDWMVVAAVGGVLSAAMWLCRELWNDHITA